MAAVSGPGGFDCIALILGQDSGLPGFGIVERYFKLAVYKGRKRNLVGILGVTGGFCALTADLGGYPFHAAPFRIYLVELGPTALGGGEDDPLAVGEPGGVGFYTACPRQALGLLAHSIAGVEFGITGSR